MYTVHNSKEIDRVVGNQLKYIVDKVVDSSPYQVEAMILSGGFGRGEGSVVKKGDTYLPINDYDIKIITRAFRAKNSKLNQISLSLAEDLHIRFVDLSYWNYYKLPILPLTMFNYDTKYGSQVIYGNPKVLQMLPNYKKGKMSRREGETLLFNRLLAPLELLGKSEGNSSDRLSFALQVGRSVMADYCALLIYSGKYSHQYEERLKWLELMDLPSKLKDAVTFSTNLKLRPEIFDDKEFDVEDALSTAIQMKFYTLAQMYKYDEDTDLNEIIGNYRRKRGKSMLTVWKKGKEFYRIEEDVIRMLYFVWRDEGDITDLYERYETNIEEKLSNSLIEKVFARWLEVHH